MNARLAWPTLRSSAMGRAKAIQPNSTWATAKRERPELAAALDFMRDGNSLVVWKLDRLARSTLDAARARGRKGGRPRALSDKDLKEARALLADPDITVEDVTRRLGVGPSTWYRYLPAARQSAQAIER